MRKWLAVLGLLLIVAPVVTSQPNKAADNKEQPTKQSQPSVIPTDSPNKQASSQADQPEPDANAPKWYTALERPDWWLVIVAALTGGVIGWQAWETRKAAQGAKENAEAAFSQIQIIREKERARIGVDLDDLKLDIVPGPHKAVQVGWSVTLYGQSDAFVHSSRCFAEVEGQNLPEFLIPAWGEMIGLPSVISCDCRKIKGIVLVHPPRPYPFDYAVLSDHLASGEQTAVCVGFVEYSDVFGGRWVFRFRRRWKFFGTPGELQGLYPRSLLSGEWAKYGTQEDNGEYPVKP
jgi:hypothetical protein